jgi:hypothetical protein
MPALEMACWVVAIAIRGPTCTLGGCTKFKRSRSYLTVLRGLGLQDLWHFIDRYSRKIPPAHVYKGKLSWMLMPRGLDQDTAAAQTALCEIPALERDGSAPPRIEGEQGAGLHGSASCDGCACHTAGPAQGRRPQAVNKFAHFFFGKGNYTGVGCQCLRISGLIPHGPAG